MGDWRKSTYSDGNGGEYVETASSNGLIMVRDTKDRDGGTLAFSAAAWAAFTTYRRIAATIIAPGPGGNVGVRAPSRRAMRHDRET
jgi:Domain of unknown function (DUF397)